MKSRQNAEFETVAKKLCIDQGEIWRERADRISRLLDVKFLLGRLRTGILTRQFEISLSRAAQNRRTGIRGRVPEGHYEAGYTLKIIARIRALDADGHV